MSQVSIKKQTVQLWGILLAMTVAAVIALAHYRYIAYSQLVAVASIVVIGVWLLNRRIDRVFEQLEASEARYRGMVQSMHEGVVVIDEEGVIQSINPAAETLFGYAVGELAGQNVRRLMPPMYADRHNDYLSRYLETGERHVIGVGREVYGRRRDGSEFPMQLYVSEMESGGRRLFTGLVHDISERKKVEAEVMHGRARAEEAAAAKSQFLANMSHEIRTPMNGVLGMLELLSQAKLQPAEKEYVHMARQSAVSLLKLIDDILDLSKIEAGRIELDWEPANLHELIEDSAAVGASLAIEKDLSLNCYIAPNVPERLPTDSARLRQVLLNLLSNAVKFTDHGEVNLTVELEEERPDGVLLRFTVADTGIGIGKDQLENLFQPFVQADHSITRRFGGTGLGLTISKRLVDLMGGSIQVSSEPGGGTVFTFTSRLGVPLPEEPACSLAASQSLRVLVVDNSATALANVENYLREFGVTLIATARDTAQARRLFRSAQAEGRGFHLVLIKRPLPGAAGYINDIRTGEGGAGAHFVEMSPLNASKKGIKRLQADRTLVRPVRRVELKILVADLALRPLDALPDINNAGKTGPPDRWIGARVLLAEDNPVNQVVCQRMLQHFGIELELVENGQQAVELTTQRKFDLVLMDCQMPVMDGYAATRAIRARESERDLPRTTIVAVTAHAMEGDRDQCLEAGMDGYIRKPYRLVELEETLHRWMPRSPG